MSVSISSARRLAAGAVGASAVAGAMLFGALPAANAASVPAAQNAGVTHVAPVWWGHHHHSHRHGGIHIA
ncbi:MAG: hypothetical protein QOE48_3914 [Mycobacterium sp.]|jgi:hypothetical protein|nr:hypothetical protein [Mycobacterium sp.]MDT5308232.1 hypothetical protein [Mycobacterium sp.]